MVNDVNQDLSILDMQHSLTQAHCHSPPATSWGAVGYGLQHTIGSLSGHESFTQNERKPMHDPTRSNEGSANRLTDPWVPVMHTEDITYRKEDFRGFGEDGDDEAGPSTREGGYGDESFDVICGDDIVCDDKDAQGNYPHNDGVTTTNLGYGNLAKDWDEVNDYGDHDHASVIGLEATSDNEYDNANEINELDEYICDFDDQGTVYDHGAKATPESNVGFYDDGEVDQEAQGGFDGETVDNAHDAVSAEYSYGIEGPEDDNVDEEPDTALEEENHYNVYADEPQHFNVTNLFDQFALDDEVEVTVYANECDHGGHGEHDDGGDYTSCGDYDDCGYCDDDY
jgi:hypothetical protein